MACAGLIFGLAFAARATFAILYGGHEPAAKFGGNKEDPQVYLWMAENLAEHGSIGFRGGPSARRPPAYPVMLAGIRAVVGSNLLAVRMVQGALDALTAVLVFAAVREFGSRRAALMSGLLYALYPIYIFNASELMTELAALLFTALATWAALRSVRTASISATVAAGAGCGLMALARESNLLLAPLWAGVLLWNERRSGARVWRVALRRPVSLLAAATLTYAPWVVRNSLLFDQFIPAGTSGGENLLRSMGKALEGESFDWPRCLDEHGLLNYWAYHNPASRGATFPDELASDRAARGLAWKWIGEHPARLAVHGLEKLALIFAQIDPAERAARGGLLRDVLTWSYRAVAMLGLVGAALLIRDGRRDVVALLGALTLTCMGVLFLFCAWKRYRYVAFDFACILLAGVAIERVVAALGLRQRQPAPKNGRGSIGGNPPN